MRKRDRMLKDSGMRLRHPPTVPTGVVWSIVAAGGVPEDWRTYLGEAGGGLQPVPVAAG